MKTFSHDYHSVSERYAPFSEINMIPFIDVVLVLLIIFMVLTPFLIQQSIKVNLPKAATGTQQPEQAVELQIDKNGTLRVQNRIVAPELLERELALIFSNVGKNSLLIQADKDIPFEKVVFALDSAKKAGAKKLGIAVSGQQTLK
ncbi:MAG: biopolymer transporter ExbD [Elusimicrobiota bacterium]